MKDHDFIKIQKNLQIWSLYDQEVPITNYNYRLKRKKKVRAASFARHVAQRARVSRPLGALIRGEAVNQLGAATWSRDVISYI